MAKKRSRGRALLWLVAVLAVAAVAVLGVRFWKARQMALPEGIASGNGRLQAKLVDVAAKEPLRVRDVLVSEGALVTVGQVVVQMDTTTIEAELAAANENVAANREKLAAANADIVKQKSEIDLAEIEVVRSGRLVQQGAGSQRELDVRRTKLETTKAALAAAEASLRTAVQQVAVAQANAATIQTRIADATLRSPVAGRVLYRLAEPGEVLAPGGKALTLLDLSDVYMEIYLPSEQAARLRIGAEGRIVLDFDPSHAIAGYVSFVSPEAQFTPKQVETRSEREKLMFRTKIQVPRDLTTQYTEQIKTGVRGMGYVKLDPSAVWPARLQNLVSVPVAGR
jgi:HlyD family secretion protein